MCRSVLTWRSSRSTPAGLGRHLEWYAGEITAGLDVYAACYPLGDPEYALTRGIITKAEADGDITGSLSIDHTVEHDASTHPGN